MTSIPDPPSGRYGTPRPGIRHGAIVTTAEGGGYVITCDCRWLLWCETEKDAAESRRAHAKKCKAGKAEVAA